MSTTPDSALQRTLATAPVACSLDAGGLRAQKQRWTQLILGAGTGRAATADGVTLTFRADDHVERELRELVATENDCCAWARWEVTPVSDGGLIMHVGATGDGAAVLQSMFLS